jgi:hypothetical protein
MSLVASACKSGTPDGRGSMVVDQEWWSYILVFCNDVSALPVGWRSRFGRPLTSVERHYARHTPTHTHTHTHVTCHSTYVPYTAGRSDICHVHMYSVHHYFSRLVQLVQLTRGSL